MKPKFLEIKIINREMGKGKYNIMNLKIYYII